MLNYTIHYAYIIEILQIDIVHFMMMSIIVIVSVNWTI